jgi:hypothetical protein
VAVRFAASAEAVAARIAALVRACTPESCFVEAGTM